MRERCTAFLFFLLLGPCSFLVLSQNLNLNMTGPGTRALGMGGAFIGVADDVTAIHWNPAGPATIDYNYETLEEGEGMHLLLSGRSRSMQVRSESSPASFASDLAPAFAGIMIPYKRSVLKNAPVSLGRFDPSIVFSAAYQSATDANKVTISQSSASLSETLKSTLNLSTASVSGAYQLSPYMSIGLTANYWFALGNQYAYTSTEQSAGTIRQEQGKYRISGLNFIGGVMFDFYENNLPLRIGAKFSTPFSLRNRFLSEGNVQAAGLETRISRSYDQKYKMPISGGVGVAYRPFWRILLTADAEVVPYQGQAIQQVFFDYNQFNSLNPGRGVPLLVDLPQRPVIAKHNQYQLRGGGEFFVLDSPQFEMRLMGGYRLQSYLNNDGSSSKAKSFSVGATLFFDRFKIHGAFEQMKYPQSNSTSVNQYTRGYFSIDLAMLLRS